MKEPGDAIASSRKLLVFDTSYPLEAVRQRGQEKPILCRDLDGFFEHVWSVHPYATLVTSDEWGPRFGRPDVYELTPRHTIIEGKIGRFSWLRWFPPLNFLLGQWDLMRFLHATIRREGISAVRGASPLYTGLFGLILARLTGVPLVLRIGANHDELRKFTGKPIEGRLFRSGYIERFVEQFVLSRADLVAGANQNNLDFALAGGAKPERSTLFRYGNLIDPRHFIDPAKRPHNRELLGELGLHGERFIISIGRLEDVGSVKHPEDIIGVLKYLKDHGADATAVVVGKGPLRNRIEAFALELGVSDRVVLAGSRNQEWLSQILPSAAVHVCPHAGRALSEAALAAVPTVAYDIDWQRELIETGKTGILVPYRDVDAMAEATKRLLDNPDEARRLGANLRARALEMLDPDRLNDHERASYRRLFKELR